MCFGHIAKACPNGRRSNVSRSLNRFSALRKFFFLVWYIMYVVCAACLRCCCWLRFFLFPFYVRFFFLRWLSSCWGCAWLKYSHEHFVLRTIVDATIYNVEWFLIRLNEGHIGKDVMYDIHTLTNANVACKSMQKSDMCLTFGCRINFSVIIGCRWLR